MICKHCGTQNPDNTRICKQCGMPLEESTAQNPVKQEESKNKTSKNVMKKKSLLLIIGIPLLAYVIGQAAGKKLGENMSGGSNSSKTVETSVEDDTQKEDNPEYTKIFTERNIDVNSINSRTSKSDIATISMTFAIQGTDELNSLIAKIRTIDSIIDIERTSS